MRARQSRDPKQVIDRCPETYGEEAQRPRSSPIPARHLRPRSAGLPRLRQSAGLSRLDLSLSAPPKIRSPTARATTTGAAARRPPKRSKMLCAKSTAMPALAWPCSHLVLRRFPPRCSPSPRAGDHVLVPDSVYRPTRNFCNGVFKRLGVGDDLLRSAYRCRHRKAVQAEHPRGFRRGPGFAKLRDAGHSGHREGRARQRRGRADGQYLGDAALFPRLREGVDLEIQAGTKYIGGHSDIMFGMRVGQCGDFAGS